LPRPVSRRLLIRHLQRAESTLRWIAGMTVLEEWVRARLLRQADAEAVILARVHAKRLPPGE
jgi:hypothetical protein